MNQRVNENLISGGNSASNKKPTTASKVFLNDRLSNNEHVSVVLYLVDALIFEHVSNYDSPRD